MTFAAARTGKSKPLRFAKSFSSSLDKDLKRAFPTFGIPLEGFL